MSRTIKVQCDFPGCGESCEQTRLAGSLEGWVRRDITDSTNKRLAEGMRDYGAAHETQFICPKHAGSGENVPSPPVHPRVVEFIAQVEDNVPPTLGASAPELAASSADDSVQADSDAS